MAILAGIDEAGFGPVLGPMVVSAAVFRVPDELAEASLWRVLVGAAARKPSKRRSAVAFADSKKLYSGRASAAGLANLERGVLAMLAAQDRPCRSLRQMLDVVCPGAAGRIRRYPWYDGQDVSLPCDLTDTDVLLSGRSLAARMCAVGLKPLALRSEVVLAGEFNRLVSATRNKSVMLLDVTSRLLDRLRRTGGRERLIIYADRQGGRIRYLPALQRLFDGCQFKILDESPAASAYRISDGGRQVELHFMAGCEQRQLPVALASMLSKYVRELFMAMFNRFWATHVPDLAPTAGYYTDGNRFYQQIAPVVRRLGFDEQLLYRLR